MSKIRISQEAIDDIIEQVHEELEEGASAARIRQIADEHPQARAEILSFAAEWFASDGDGVSDDEQVVGDTPREHADLLDRYWNAVGPVDDNLVDGLDPDRLRDVAGRCRIDLDILRKLARGRIEPNSVPGILVGWLGHELSLPNAQVWTSLVSADSRMHADYFAPGGKRIGAKVTFAEAVRSSQLGDDDRRFWLDRLEA